MRPINEVIIHCTATRPKWREGQKTSTKVKAVKRWHVEDRNWSDIGYHFLIDRDGTIADGRDIERVGAHTRGHNTGSVGVALFGGHGSAATDDFADNFTEDQERSLRKLIDDLSEDFEITKLSGHNEYSSKACPGFFVPGWYTGMRTPPPSPKVAPLRLDLEPATAPSWLSKMFDKLAAFFSRSDDK